MIRTLRFAQSLTHLTLHTRWISDDGLSELEWVDSRGQNACPSLVSLKITITGEVEFRQIHSRANGHSSSTPQISAEQLANTVHSRVEKQEGFFMYLQIACNESLEYGRFACDAVLNALADQGVLRLEILQFDSSDSSSSSSP